MTSVTCSTLRQDMLVDGHLCYQLHRVGTRFIHRWDRFLRPHGVTYTEYIVLLTVLERSPVGEMTLGDRLRLDPYVLDDALTKLEQLGALIRSVDYGMLGHRVVEATEQGYAMQDDLAALRERFSCDLGLPAADAATLITQLQKLELALSGAALDEHDRLVGQS